MVLFGLSTDRCVSTAARVASNLGFRTIVVGDASACFDLTDADGGSISADEVSRVDLATLRAEFAQVVDTEALLADRRNRLTCRLPQYENGASYIALRPLE